MDNEKHEVFIDVIVVADMSFLHKQLRRGGGSHSCTNFAFYVALIANIGRKVTLVVVGNVG